MNRNQLLQYKRHRHERNDVRPIPQEQTTIGRTYRTAEPQYANDIRRPLAESRRLHERLAHRNKSFQQQTSKSATTSMTPRNPHKYATNTSRVDQEAHTMDTWLGEWDTAFSNPQPSNIRSMSLLLLPTGVDLENHSENAKEAQLIHYCPEMTPEGRMEQELRLIDELDEQLKSHLERGEEEQPREIERRKGRKAVVEQSRRAEVIDLTEDQTVNGRALRSIPGNLATRQPPAPTYDIQQPSYHGLPWVPYWPSDCFSGNMTHDALHDIGTQKIKWAHNDQGQNMLPDVNLGSFVQPGYHYAAAQNGPWNSLHTGLRRGRCLSWQEVNAPWKVSAAPLQKVYYHH